MARNQLLKLVILVHLYYIHELLADFDGDTSSHGGEWSTLLCKSCGRGIFAARDLIYKKSPFAIQTWNDTLFQHSSMMSGDDADDGDKDKDDDDNNSSSLNSTGPSRRRRRVFFTMVQLVRNPHGHTFELVTVRRADLLLLNNTRSEEDTWFPNFAWIIGVCPHCFNHLGWYFESLVGEDGFFALILDQLINQDFADSLVITPKLKMF